MWWPVVGGGGGGGGGGFSPLLVDSAASSLLPAGWGGSAVDDESIELRFCPFPGGFELWWCISGPAGWKYPGKIKWNII